MNDEKSKDFAESADLFRKLQKAFAMGLKRRKFLIDKLQTFGSVKHDLDLLQYEENSSSEDQREDVIEELIMTKRDIAYTEHLIAKLDRKMTALENTLKKMQKELRDWKAI